MGNSLLILKVINNIRTRFIVTGSQAFGVLHCTWLTDREILVECSKMSWFRSEVESCVCMCVSVCPLIRNFRSLCLDWAYENQTKKMCSEELCVLHTYRLLPLHPHTQAHMPWEKTTAQSWENIHCRLTDAVAGTFSSTVSRNIELSVETRAQFSARARPLWQVGAVPQPVQALLGVLHQVFHAAV